MRKISFLLLMLNVLAACSPYLHQPLQTRPARLGVETHSMKALHQLPPPEDKIVAAVYKFRDQTGQYKESETGVNWSTAVTQGATSILLRALEESQWFIPIEREGLSNLLNERKIIRSSRLNYGQEEDPQNVLPPLLFAGILLEGGIISFDSNVLTGGAGLRYFGAGASGQYREDRVTIYLRAISTSNGRILKTVYTTKTILSQMVDAGLFRFVKFQRLLEAETGFTYNEPTELAVREAIEKAVFSMVVEGVQEGLWQLANQEDLDSPVLESYQQEKERNIDIDEFGIFHRDRRNKFAVGLHPGIFYYGGDYANPEPQVAGSISLSYQVLKPLTLQLELGKGILATSDFYRQPVDFISLSTDLLIFPRYRYTPYLTIGAGLITPNENQVFSLSPHYVQAIGGGGVEYLIDDRFSLNLEFLHHYLFDDTFDGIEQGRYNDFFWSGNFGIKYYFEW